MRPKMRAYSHQGHGPRADQTGRIHISDFRNPRTISLAKRSRSIHRSHLQTFAAPKRKSALPPKADVRRANQHAGFGPTPEVGCATSRKSAAEISMREGRFSVVTLPAAIRQSFAPPMPWRMCLRGAKSRHCWAFNRFLLTRKSKHRGQGRAKVAGRQRGVALAPAGHRGSFRDRAIVILQGRPAC